MFYYPSMKLHLRLLLPLASALCAPLLAEDNLKYGQPACGAPVLDKQYFVICYDADHKTPKWVGYALTKDDANNKTTARDGSFKADPELPKGQRAQNSDYDKRYDKGHMAPANDFTRSVVAMKSTFILSNAVPQKPGVNRGRWKELEAAVHDYAAAQGTVWVLSGPIFGAKKLKTIGKKVGVPTHTFKVVLCVRANGEKEMYGYILPNVDKPSGTLASYAFSINRIEAETGLDFFNALPKDEQKRLEAAAKTLPGK
jgi:endonuclease G, mitochondrial